MNLKSNIILEGLDNSRKVNEEVTTVVKSAVKSLFAKTKTPSDVQKKINNILNTIYKACNSFGSNSFTGGKYEYNKGMIGSDGDGESGMIEPDVDPSVHKVKIQVKFESKVSIGDVFEKVKSDLKLISSNYEKVWDDGPDVYYIVKEDGHASDFGVCVSYSSKVLEIEVYRQVNPLTESATPEKIASMLGKVNSTIAGKTVEVNFGIDKFHSKLIDAGWSYDSKRSEPGNPIYYKDGCVIKLSGSGRKTRINIVEGTEISDISTPEGNLDVSKIKKTEVICPKCKSTNVNIREDNTFHCSECGYEWTLEEMQKEVKERKKIAVKEEAVLEGKYKVGKRYRTDDNMYFVVKKVNKDGTLRVYDEDVEKEYDVEVSDVELLNPTEVK